MCLVTRCLDFFRAPSEWFVAGLVFGVVAPVVVLGEPLEMVTGPLAAVCGPFAVVVVVVVVTVSTTRYTVALTMI